MANITAAEVNKLRQTTGAGMMDCKKALVEAEGNFDTAIEILRKKGQKVAANRADRDSSEGAAIAVLNSDNTQGVAISLNCETDFVAKNDSFVALATELASLALNFDTKEAFLGADFKGMSVQEKLTEQLQLLDLDDTQYVIADTIIGNLDESGYLNREIESIVDDLAFSANIMVTEAEIEEVLLVIQELDPAGVGARDLQECLLIQASHKNEHPEK